MNFSAAQFERFCGKLKISSKESGTVPLKWTGGQRYFVQEIERGIKEGIHTFFVLKARQLHISTICLALDLYWMFLHKGLQGGIITDTDENREKFKSYLTQYHRSLPKGASRVEIAAHNRVQMVLKNNSALSYIVAGKRKNESLGAGSALSYIHATEVATYGDEEGMKSLIATLAQKNKDRLFIFESTAYGYNMWYEMCEQAKTSKTQRFIFIGWWRNEFYSCPRNSVEFKTYWDGAPTTEEREWMREVYEEYKVNISPEQLAWWRWAADDICKGDMNTMYQMYPPIPHYAFQMSGSKFFSGERVNIAYKEAIQTKPAFYRYQFGIHYEQTKFIETNEEQSEILIWEEPVNGAQYVMGADPAYGSSEWADRFAISIWRCFADKMVQVAEVCTDAWNPAKFAWVLAHLAGSYSPCMVNLELQGPGETVYNELNHLRRYTSGPGVDQTVSKLYSVTAGIRDFLWKKVDTMSSGFAMQSRNTSSGMKVTLMETLRSYFEREALIVNSPYALEEFRHISRDGDKIGGEGRAKDDLVIAAALAVMAWDRWIKAELRARNRTFAIEMAPRGEQRAVQPVEKAVLGYMNKIGVKEFGGQQ